MTRLEVELDDFVDAARTMHFDIGEPVRHATTELASVLSECGEMAGDDEGGRQWAAAYDTAARTLLTATSRFAAGAFATANLFGRSAGNYAEAEAASAAGPHTQVQALVARIPPHIHVTAPQAPPSAAGGGGDEPWGWAQIKHVINAVWPNGQQDRLRQAARAYRHCASVMDQAAEQPTMASILFARDRLPECDDVIAVCRGMTERGRSLADAHRTLANSCDGLADHIDTCHSEVEAELRQFGVETATLQVAGGVLSAVTFGLAEIPTQITQTALVARIAARVGELLERFPAAVRAVHAAIPLVTERVEGMLQALGKLADAQVVAPAISRVDRLGRMKVSARGAGAAGAEIRSAARLQAEANNLRRGKRGRDFVKAEDQKHILDGDGIGKGGHRWSPKPADPTKSLFPREWDDDMILDSVADIVRSPATVWHVQGGSGGLYTKSGLPAVWRAWEVRNGVRIRVAWEPATGKIRTAFPDVSPAKGDVVP